MYSAWARLKIVIVSFYILLYLIFFSVPFYAQKFERISLEQGLSHGAVYSIVQDTKGFIWFGTEEGLDRYDGYTINVFRHDPTNPASMSSNDIGKILVEPSGIMWIGTWGSGLDRYDPKTHSFIHFLHNPDDPESLSENRIELIFRDSKGILWIGTEKNGLNQFDEAGKRFIRYRHEPGNPSSLIGPRPYAKMIRNNCGLELMRGSISWTVTQGLLPIIEAIRMIPPV